MLSVTLLSAGAFATSDDPPLLQIDAGGHRGNVNAVIFSKDGQTLYSAGQDKIVRVWNWRTGKPLRTIRGRIGPGFDGVVFDIALSPDESTLAVAGRMHAECPERCGDIRLFDASTGQLNKTLSGAHRGTVSSLAFSADGKTLLSGGWDGRVVKWSLAGTTAHHILAGHQTVISRVAFGGDGSRAVSLDRSGQYRVWNLKTGRELRSAQAHEGEAKGLAVSKDGAFFATAGRDQMLRIFNLETGDALFSQKAAIGELTTLRVSPNGKRLLVGVGTGTGASLISEIGGDAPPVVLEGATSVIAADISPAGDVAALAVANRIDLFDTKTGKRLRQLAGHGRPKTGVGFDRDGNLAWGSEVNPGIFEKLTQAMTAGGTMGDFTVEDGALVAKVLIGSATADEVRLLDQPRLRKITESILGPDTVNRFGSLDTVLRLPNSRKSGLAAQLGVPRPLAPERTRAFKRAATRLGPYEIRYEWGGRPATPMGVMKVLKAGEVVGSGQTGSKPGCLLSTYGLVGPVDAPRIVGAGCSSGLYDTTGKRIGEFVGHQQGVSALAVSPDQRVLATASGDQTVRLWNVQSRELIVSIFAATDGEWIIWTPSGHYAASPRGDRMIGWHINRGDDQAAMFVSADQLRKHFYRPDIVSRALQLASADAAIEEARAVDPDAFEFSIDHLRNSTPPRFEISTRDSVDGRFAEITIKLDAVGEPAQALNVRVNERNVTPAELRAFKPNSDQTLVRTVRIPLAPGQNEIEVSASNAAGIATRGAFVMRRTSVKPARRGTLYVVAVGVDDYDTSVGLGNLRFAAADARAFSDRIAATLGTQHENTKTLLISPGGDKEPTSSNIRRALRFFRNATADDTTVLFLAGHGVQDGADYLFLPANAKRIDDDWDPDSVLLWSTLEAAIARVKGRRLLFVDTCRSGGAYNSRLIKDTADSGVIAFSATDAEALAEERGDLGHGVFTFALLEGLSGKADVFPVGAPDGAINMYELAAFVTDKVNRLTDKAQRPELNARKFTDFVVARLDTSLTGPRK